MQAHQLLAAFLAAAIALAIVLPGLWLVLNWRRLVYGRIGGVARCRSLGPHSARAVLDALREYAAMGDVDAEIGGADLVADRCLLKLANEGEPDLALWLMVGVALEKEHFTRLGFELRMILDDTSRRTQFGSSSVAGRILADLRDEMQCLSHYRTDHWVARYGADPDAN